MKKDSPAYVVAFTVAVCAAFVFLLALANELTRERTAANRRFAERSAVLSALGVPVGADAASVDAAYSAVTALEADGFEVYRAEVAGEPRFAKRFQGPGLWGTIYGVVAVDAAVERVLGFRLVSHNETPGLGGRIDEAWFQEQFSGERIGEAGVRVRAGSGKGDADPDNGELDAVTGASRTSDAVQAIVNAEIAAFRALRDRGGLK